MRKILLAIFVFTFLCSGCVNKENRSSADNMIKNTNPQNQIELDADNAVKDEKLEIEASLESEDVAQDISPKKQTLTSSSPDGKYPAEAYGTVSTITAAGLYPYEGIHVINTANGDVIWKMEPGYYVVDFTWSPVGRHIGIYYEARSYGESIIFDVINKKEIALPALADIVSHYGKGNKPQENRPGIY